MTCIKYNKNLLFYSTQFKTQFIQDIYWNIKKNYILILFEILFDTLLMSLVLWWILSKGTDIEIFI